MNDAELQYSNREIREFVGEIKTSLKRIEDQTLRTNGRVSSLERWRSYIAGGLAVLTVVGFPIVMYLFSQVNNLSGKVQAATTVDLQTKLKP